MKMNWKFLLSISFGILVIEVLSRGGDHGDHGGHDHGGHDHGGHDHGGHDHHDHGGWGGHDHHDHWGGHDHHNHWGGGGGDHDHGNGGGGGWGRPYRPWTGWGGGGGYYGGGRRVGLLGRLFGWGRNRGYSGYPNYGGYCRVAQFVDYVGRTARFYCDCPPYPPNYQWNQCSPMYAYGK